jgi:hypothetical protein
MRGNCCMLDPPAAREELDVLALPDNKLCFAFLRPYSAGMAPPGRGR